MKHYNQSFLQEEEISNLMQFKVERTASRMLDENEDEETDDFDETTDEEALQVDEPAEGENQLPSEHADLQEEEIEIDPEDAEEDDLA